MAKRLYIQLYNAKELENVGAAKIILNDDLKGQVLNKEIRDIVENKTKMAEMGNNALKISVNNVEDKIYKEILKLVK